MIFIWISLCLIYATDTSVYASYTSGCTFRFLTEHTCIGSQYKLMERPIHDLKSWPKKEFDTKLRKKGSLSEKFRNWLNSISHQFFFHTHFGWQNGVVFWVFWNFTQYRGLFKISYLLQEVSDEPLSIYSRFIGMAV